eukprot:CAMPEP_0184440082 /NCGR_PEP_ID=MMETSP0738-20130409/749763_1 /TAXON_ID=385413 /ORGANISM="Thalassiosira miniscula, Strain CCMP1093" /LENGTH=46 /DNA_ID= /DNA_START= /DNA_END= /DNA_ORIENTATION=
MPPSTATITALASTPASPMPAPLFLFWNISTWAAAAATTVAPTTMV